MVKLRHFSVAAVVKILSSHLQRNGSVVVAVFQLYTAGNVAGLDKQKKRKDMWIKSSVSTHITAHIHTEAER